MESNPYSPPVADSSQATQGGQSINGPYGPFRHNGSLKNATVTLLVIDAMLVLFSGLLNILDIKQQNSDAYLLSEGPSKLDQIISLSETVHLPVILILAVLFGIWIVRSCKNGWLLDAPHMKTTPAWSVGYFFIPILSLWKPYLAIKEIRRASFGNDHALKKILPLWWTFWLVSIILNNVIAALYTRADDQESYLAACKLDLVAVPVDTILNYLAIALITQITAAQYRRAAQWQV